MLGLPTNTELNKQLPKKLIYTKNQLNSATKDRIDRDISTIKIVNEITPSKINIKEGESVKSFYVLLIELKNKDYDEKSIILISKLIPQNTILVLKYENEIQIAIYYHSKLLSHYWTGINDITLILTGLDLDSVWENIVVQVGNLEIDNGNSIAEQIDKNEHRQKILTIIEKMDKAARTEKQPKKKFEIVQRINELKRDLEDI